MSFVPTFMVHYPLDKNFCQDTEISSGPGIESWIRKESWTNAKVAPVDETVYWCMLCAKLKKSGQAHPGTKVRKCYGWEEWNTHVRTDKEHITKYENWKTAHWTAKR